MENFSAYFAHSSGSFHPGSTSGSPLVTLEEESKQELIVDLNPFMDFFWQIQSSNPISNHVVALNNESSKIPGISSNVNFNQVITTLGATLPSTAGMAGQAGSLLSCEENLNIPKFDETKPNKKERGSSAIKKRKIEHSREKDSLSNISQEETLRSEETIGIHLKEKCRDEIKREFEMLATQHYNINNEDFIPFQKERMSDALKNLEKNQNLQDLPYNATRFQDDLIGPDFYIDASYLPSLPVLAKSLSEPPKDPWNNRIILSAHPSETTIKDFWCMAYLAGTKSIIMITEDVDNAIDYCPPPEKAFKWGSLRIKTESFFPSELSLPRSKDTLYSQMLSIKHKEEDFDLITHQWTLVQKTKDSLLDAQDLLACIKEIKLFSEIGSVIFHSRSCISGNGTILAICCFFFQTQQLIQKAKQRMEIDVYKFMIHLRENCRYGMVQTLEEYQLIYNFLHLLQEEKREPQYKVRKETPAEAEIYAPFITPKHL